MNVTADRAAAFLIYREAVMQAAENLHCALTEEDVSTFFDNDIRVAEVENSIIAWWGRPS